MVGLAVGLVLLVVIGGLVAMQLPSVRDYALTTLEGVLGSEEAPATLAGLNGTFPTDWTLDRLILRDADGPWLEVEGAGLTWHPFRLLRGDLAIESLGAQRVALHRLPPPGAPQEEPPGDEPFRLPELPQSVPPLSLERLFVERIELGAPVIGEGMVLTLDGRLGADRSGQVVDAKLDLHRIDQQSASVVLDARADLRTKTIALDLQAKETGGLLAKLSKQPELGDLDLRLQGEGTLERFPLALNLALGGVGSVTGPVHIELPPEPSLELTWRFVPEDGGLIPAEALPVLRPETTLHLQAAMPAPQDLQVQVLRIDLPAASLQAEGALDTEARTMALQANADIPELAAFAELAKTHLAGAASADIELTGTFDAPELAVDLGYSELESATLRSATGDLRAHVTPTAGGVLDLALDGELAGLAPSEGPDLPADRLTLDGTGQVVPGERAEITALTLAFGALGINANGTVDLATRAGQAELSLQHDDLSELAGLAGMPLAGALNAKIDVASADQLDPVSIVVDAEATDLAGLPQGAEDVIGPTPKLQARAVMTPGQTIALEDLSLTGTGMNVAAFGEHDPNTGSVSGRLEADIADLAPLGALAGTPMAGALDGEVDVAGTISAPRVAADVRIDGFAVADQQFDRVTLLADARDGASGPAGTVRLQADRGAASAVLETAYSLDPGTSVTLSDLRVQAPSTSLQGEATIALGDQPLIDGSLKGRSTNLAALRPFVPVDLGGSATIELTAAASDGRQDAVINAQIDDLQGPVERLERATVQARARDVFGTLALEAQANVSGLQQGTSRIETAEVTASGDLRGMRIEATAQGDVGQPVSLQTSADVALNDGAQEITLRALDASYGEEALVLRQPATVRVQGTSMALENLDADLAGGRLTGTVRVEPSRVTGEIVLDGVDLAVAESFGGPPLRGNAGARIDLSGTPDAPNVRLRTQVAQMQPSEAGRRKIPAIDLDLQATIDPRRLVASLEARGATPEPLRADVDTPVVFSLQPFAFQLPQGAGIQGGFNGEIDLATLNDMIALDGQRVAGILDLDVAFGGTPQAPEIGGSIDLTGGSYTNAELGTTLEDITLRLRADNGVLRVNELSAHDGGEGRISGSGQIGIDPQTGLPFELGVRMERATLVRRDDATVTISGTIDVDGDQRAGDVVGRLTLDRADIGIPEGGGPNFVTIDVKEVGGDAAEEDDQAGGVPYRLALDIVVEIPARMFVRGRGLETEWQGRITVRDTADSPLVLGELEVRRGYMDLVDRRFDITRGIIEFDGAKPPNPIINIETEVQAPELTAIFGISGRADNLQFSSSSQPQLPGDEILAQVLFGKRSSELTTGEQITLAAGIAKLAGTPGSDPFSIVRASTGLDTLDVQGVAGDDPSVTAGKYLTDDIFVEYERSLSDKPSKTRVEVELNDYIQEFTNRTPRGDVQATGEVTSDSRTGLGLKWTFDY